MPLPKLVVHARADSFAVGHRPGSGHLEPELTVGARKVSAVGELSVKVTTPIGARPQRSLRSGTPRLPVDRDFQWGFDPDLLYTGTTEFEAEGDPRSPASHSVSVEVPCVDKSAAIWIRGFRIQSGTEHPVGYRVHGLGVELSEPVRAVRLTAQRV